jgi:hypothetical protein
MWIIDLKQMHQYFGTQVALRGGCAGTNTEVVKWLGPSWVGNEGRVKRTGRDEPIGIVIHKCLETTQGITLCSYLYLKFVKTPCFSNNVLCFFFYKIREQESRTGLGASWQSGT